MDDLKPEVSRDQLMLEDQLGVRPRWPARYGIFAVITAYGVVYFSGGSALAPIAIFGQATHTDIGWVAFLMLAFVQDTAFVLSAIGFASVAQPLKRELFGLRKVKITKALKWIAVAILIFLPVELVLVYFFGDDSGPSKHISAFGWVTFGIAAVVFAPLAEEFLFRGFIFQAFRNRVGLIFGAIFSSLIFGILHYKGVTWVVVPFAFMFGIAQCTLFYKTKSLYPGMGLHAANNAVVLVLAIAAS